MKLSWPLVVLASAVAVSAIGLAIGSSLSDDVEVSRDTVFLLLVAAVVPLLPAVASLEITLPGGGSVKVQRSLAREANSALVDIERLVAFLQARNP